MSTVDIDEIIRMIERGEKVKVRFPNGLERELGPNDIDDLVLGKQVNKFLADAYDRLIGEAP